MPKSIYLNDNVLEQLKNIKPYFSELGYIPDDTGIISAALNIYEDFLKDKKTLEAIKKSEIAQT